MTAGGPGPQSWRTPLCQGPACLSLTNDAATALTRVPLPYYLDSLDRMTMVLLQTLPSLSTAVARGAVRVVILTHLNCHEPRGGGGAEVGGRVAWAPAAG